jgi:hypothetical protein
MYPCSIALLAQALWLSWQLMRLVEIKGNKDKLLTLKEHLNQEDQLRGRRCTKGFYSCQMPNYNS